MSEFLERRKKLSKELSQTQAYVVASAPECVRNYDVHFPYRQNSHFYYLTGLDEPHLILVLLKGRSILFVAPEDPVRKIWLGPRLCVKDIKEKGEFDEVYEVTKFSEKVQPLLKDVKEVFYKKTGFLDKEIEEAISSKNTTSNFGQIAEMRFVKSGEEIRLMKKSAKISSSAHQSVMKAARKGVGERALSGLFFKEVLKGGAGRLAYESIVAAGPNGVILHYCKNDSLCEDKRLLLIDAAGEFEHYASDITRTYPINGKFEPFQKDIYEALLEVQISTIEEVAPGKHFQEIQDHCTKGICEVLKRFKILTESPDEIFDKKLYVKYFPHYVGHFLGLDVHDTEDLKDAKTKPFVEGVCLTVEPGIYISEEDSDAPSFMKGLGIRIEDDILVTKGGFENLSESCPKGVKEMEALVGKNPELI